MLARFQIGRAAQETGLSVDAIRFYQKMGLIEEPPRTSGGYRTFDAGQLRELHFIHKAQELGFSLAEIKELALLRRQPAHTCSQMRDLLGHKLATVQQKIAELARIQRELGRALRKCKRELRLHRSSFHDGCCPVLAEIERK